MKAFRLEDFLEQKNMVNQLKNKSLSKIKDFIVNHCIGEFHNEVCGLIGWDEIEKKYVASIEPNEAEDPKNFFVLNPASFLRFKNAHSLLGVYHSHIIGDESPSEFDIKMSEACCVPFFIYSLNTSKFYIYEPQNIDFDVNVFAKLKTYFKK
jgi:proteasome lid subunit RPN8/RPN11